MYEKFTDRKTNVNLISTRNYLFIFSPLVWLGAGRVLGGEPRPGAVIQAVLGRQAGSQHRPHRHAHRHLHRAQLKLEWWLVMSRVQRHVSRVPFKCEL